MPDASSSSDDMRSWRYFARRLPVRLLTYWPLKLTLGVALGTLFTAAYLLIGHYPLLPVHVLPFTWFDRVTGFHPIPWVWVYQSVYLPMNLIPWLSERREELRRYVRGFIILSIVSFTVFILVPTRAPKPSVSDPQGMYWLLQLYDAPNNALPSLHIGLLVYTFAFGRRVLAGEMPRGTSVICLVWGLLIAYSTLATKEHYFVDLPAGAALGIAAHWLAWRQPRAVMRDQTAPRRSRSAVEPLPARY